MPDLENEPTINLDHLSRGHGPKNPLDTRIYHSNICVRCLYNIPQGTCMLALPGTIFLLMGLIVLPWTTVEEGWSEGTQQAGMIFVIFGGILFISGSFYCCYYYRKAGRKPGQSKNKKSVTPHPPKQHVELVGVYKMRQDGMSVPTETLDNQQDFSIATIS